MLKRKAHVPVLGLVFSEDHVVGAAGRNKYYRRHVIEALKQNKTKNQLKNQIFYVQASLEPTSSLTPSHPNTLGPSPHVAWSRAVMSFDMSFCSNIRGCPVTVADVHEFRETSVTDI